MTLLCFRIHTTSYKRKIIVKITKRYIVTINVSLIGVVIVTTYGNTKLKFKPVNRWKTSKSELRYKTWRKNVFELNKAKKGLSKFYVCEKCNKRLKTTRALHAHHRKSWDKFPKDRYNRDNGCVLCWKCHNAFHRKYKFEALSKPELLDEYLKKNEK